jgi:hypothetical protein
LICPAALVVVLMLLIVPAGAASRHTSGCVGVDATVGSDYSFVGSGYRPGAAYVVEITVPNGSSFEPVAVADANGNWSETWYANMPGAYAASVATYGTDRYVGSCSLTVS